MRHLAVLLLSSALACSSDADPGQPNGGLTAISGGSAGTSGASGAAPAVCVAGKQESCACPSGTGVQACRSDGSGFAACVCQGPTGGAAGGIGGGAGVSGAQGATGAWGGPAGLGGGTLAGGTGGGAGTAAQGGGAVGTPGDADGDGWGPEGGDCDDGEAGVNPGAYEVVGNGKDDDCDGAIDETPSVCDSGIGPAIADPLDAARALGLCGSAVAASPVAPQERRPGVVAAAFSDIAGAFLSSSPKDAARPDLQLGVLPGFGAGTSPREGSSLFALSTGLARVQADACTTSKSYDGSKSIYPPGFPKQGACGASGKPGDGVALDLRLRVPTNAKSFKFNFRLFTCEYPSLVCSTFNDVFAVLMAPSPLQTGDSMADATNASANVAFETIELGKKGVIGVNNTTFLTSCEKSSTDKTAPYLNCAGTEDLVGTGFENRGASGWLESRIPVPNFPPGADRVISLRFAIWDSQDQLLDTTVLADRFEWSTEQIETPKTSLLP